MHTTPKSEIREQLGLSQREMALLLQVSIARWSMYESGLRELPPQALELFAALTKHNASKPATATTKSTDHKTQREQLDKLARENQYQHAKLSRAAATHQKKMETAFKRGQLQAFLKSNQQFDKSSFADALQSKRHQSSDERESLLLEHKQALLDFEKKWLESKLRLIENA